MSNASSTTALVTGASRGIGFATAKRLASTVGHLTMVARDETWLEESAAELRSSFPGVDVSAYALDIGDETAVKGLFQYVQKRGNGLDILVNAAGVMNESALAMTRADDLLSTFQTNVFGSYYCCQYAARLMSRSGSGSIINLASISGEQGVAGQSAYAASKSALSGLTRSLAKELGPLGIRVNAVAPGFIDTDLTANYQGEHRDKIIDQILMGRSGTVDEVAALIEFLASDQASYITGQVIPISGGLKL